MNTPLRRRSLVGLAVWRLAGVLTVAVLLSVLYLYAVGAPDWARHLICRRVSAGSPMAVEADVIRFGPPRSVLVEGLRVYRKGVVGPPFVEAERAVVAYDPARLLEKIPALSFVEVTGARVRLQAGREGVSRPGEPSDVRWKSRIVLKECELCGVAVEEAACDLSGEGASLRFNGVNGTARRLGMRGRFQGDLVYRLDAGALDGNVVLEMDPRLVLPILDECGAAVCAEVFRRFDFGAALPRGEVKFSADCRPPFALRLDAGLWLRDCQYQGVSLLRADGRLAVNLSKSQGTVSLQDLLVVRPEGIAKCSLCIRPGEEEVTMDLTSALDPAALAQLVGIYSAERFASTRFEGPVNVTARGRVDFGAGGRTDLSVSAAGRSVGFGRFLSDDCSVVCRVRGRTNSISSITGHIFGGGYAGAMAVVWPPTGDETGRTTYELNGEAQGIVLGAVAAAFGQDAERHPGRLRLKGRLAGEVGDPRSMTGSGELRVSDGRVFLMPVFGGLSEYLAQIIPGVDFILRQTDARASFTVADRQIRAQKVSIEGDVLSLSGEGRCGFDQTVDFAVQVRLMKEHTLVAKLLRVVTYPISKLLEFKLEGTLSEPKWYPVSFAKALLQRLRGEPRGSREAGEEP
jgi:hypothetical protein